MANGDWKIGGLDQAVTDIRGDISDLKKDVKELMAAYNKLKGALFAYAAIGGGTVVGVQYIVKSIIQCFS